MVGTFYVLVMSHRGAISDAIARKHKMQWKNVECETMMQCVLARTTGVSVALLLIMAEDGKILVSIVFC